ncbi:MAG: MBL fold metallo-hydrolase [Clostridia bacterium]|nr:MBL fold metallo-hydrolase [Clostridia bacterium]
MIEKIIIGELGTNCYILYNDEYNECILIDPANDYDAIIDKCNAIGKIPKYILLTHGHFDHVGACGKLKENNGAKIYISEKDADTDTQRSIAGSLGFDFDCFVPDGYVSDGDILTLIGFEIKVIATPGHSQGSVCYIIESEKTIFAGDTIMYLSYGRYDFIGGNYSEIKDSIINKLFTLDGDYRLLSGHGRETSLSFERKYNMILL